MPPQQAPYDPDRVGARDPELVARLLPRFECSDLEACRTTWRRDEIILGERPFVVLNGRAFVASTCCIRAEARAC
jgi:hypothetical protein